MRRLLAPVAFVAALVSATTSAAALEPVKRRFGEVEVPRVRAWEGVPARQSSGRVRVIATLALPPLAAARGTSRFSLGVPRRQLDVHSAASRTYLARVTAAQRAAAARIRAAIPEARIGRRFQVVLNGLTVEVPTRKLPKLMSLGFARVYPSYTYRLNLNRSPSIIGADALSTATGVRGEGIKIGVVDDGVDHTNPFFNPAGFTYPAGFPQGDLRFTSPKVIVARSFPGPGSGAPGQLPVDRQASFHGTHVAGIAAGNAGTSSPGGRDHPPVQGLTGVAPRAWIGNYRVFNVPTPIGHLANTPEIVAAFEAAVRDGMDIINFSGGGPESDPHTDAMIATVGNTAAAGVVPVISAGNDRDDFGGGTAGSPGTAPAAITVAAATNLHVFEPQLSVTAPDAPSFLRSIPIANRGTADPNWSIADQPLVDVTTIVAANGQPVDQYLCGPPSDPNNERLTPLPAGSLQGAIALAWRGRCTFVSKAARVRAAGGIGLVLVNNRFGEPSAIPVDMAVPGGMISDLDGARLHEYLTTGRNGRTTIRMGRQPLELETGRSGVVTFFSSAGPTAFEHRLKPDVSAPGGSILSSTLPEFTGGSPFAVFDGTSMSAPHVAGAAALLIQRHPAWNPRQVRSALSSTAGPAWGDTARTQEASVLLEGAGLVNLARADNPVIFTEPQSLSYGDLNVNERALTRDLEVSIADAGGGAGTWQIEIAPQSASAGAVLTAPAVTVPPGGQTLITVRAFAAADAQAGDNYGFLVLRRGDATRRIPYLFLVTRPALESTQPRPLARFHTGNTAQDQSRVERYRFPEAPFGLPPSFSGPPMVEDGSEQTFAVTVDRPVANVGVAADMVFNNTTLIDPFLLGELDENSVQGPAGTPANVNPLTFGFQLPNSAAAAVLPVQGDYYVSVDSGRDPFTGQRLAGRYRLRSWVNDVTPPAVRLLTTVVAAGRPTLAMRATDAGAGVDPLELAIGYQRVAVGAAAYDPESGLALFPIPIQAPRLTATGNVTLISSDYQESKNVNTQGENIMPNTTFREVRLQIVSRPTLVWLRPESRECVSRPQQLLVLGSSTAAIRSVRFLRDGRPIRTIRRSAAGLYSTNWAARNVSRGAHRLTAILRDASGRTATATRVVRVCR